CRVANNAFQEYGSQIPQLKDYATETAMDVIRTGGSDFSQAPDSLKIKCPIIILTDGYTGSAAEDFAVTMKNLDLATLVGSHTCGVISHPRYFDLPSGYKYGLSTWAYYNPDGTGILETGIIPDVEVEYTSDDLVNGKDSQLKKAIEILTQK
ncbi:MAG: peptidase S41, partial [Muribaculaceae bacterium]|nr:peptidase S41 [Muribaculaceae bacterium]